jgi:hypothetical protein
MPDIYSRNTDTFGGSFSADAATLTFPQISSADGTREGAVAGLLVQNISLQYAQRVTRLFEIGTPNIYYVGGRTEGQGTIQRVIGPRKLVASFYKTYGDVCNAATNTIQITLGVGCESAGNINKVSYIAHFVVITAVAITITAADMLINENTQLMFSSFLQDETAA